MTAANMDFERRFGGIDRLYGPGSLQQLANVHVCVIGIGGVGSWAAEALARCGLGRLTLVDLDHIAESNTNRQIHAMEGEYGRAKVEAMASRIRLIHPACVVQTIDDFVTPKNVASLLPDCDAVLDAIDDNRAKAALIAHCRARGLPVVTTGGAGGRCAPTRLRVADLARTEHDPLAAKLRALLRKEYGFPRGPGQTFGVDCVFSTEPIRRPLSLCEASGAASQSTSPQGLNCAGYGSVVMVTASFGMAAAACLVDRLLARTPGSEGA